MHEHGLYGSLLITYPQKLLHRRFQIVVKACRFIPFLLDTDKIPIWSRPSMLQYVFSPS